MYLGYFMRPVKLLFKSRSTFERVPLDLLVSETSSSKAEEYRCVTQKPREVLCLMSSLTREMPSQHDIHSDHLFFHQCYYFQASFTLYINLHFLPTNTILIRCTTSISLLECFHKKVAETKAKWSASAK